MKSTTRKKTSPRRRAATAKPSTAGKRIEFSPEPSLRRALDAASRKQRVPKSVILTQALQKLLGTGRHA